ncbi:MAG: nucleoside deaminase [Bacteroidota bacterium]|nr:nucleoside deaminase [Bacteroidota bacterium]
MKQAYHQAQNALMNGEVPVGAVIVSSKTVIAKSYNQCQLLNDATAHAEMLAITAASNYLGAKYLKKCTLYVTLEPCIMCAGALFWSQIERVVFAVPDPERGFSKLSKNILHPKTFIKEGILVEECKLLIDGFFRDLRN